MNQNPLPSLIVPFLLFAIQLMSSQHVYRQVITNQREVAAVSNAAHENLWQPEVCEVVIKMTLFLTLLILIP
jgi:hypothetical protein